jgi:rod shape-determining protein MreD
VKRVAIAWVVALVGLLGVGAAAAWLPRGWLPDPSLLVAVAAGLRLRGADGVLAASAAGWTADALSGGPLGVHALLDLLAFAVTRAVQGRVDLDRGVLLALLVAALTAGHAAGEWALAGRPAAGGEALRIGLAHVLANAIAALPVKWLLDALLGRLDDDEPARGSLRLDPGAGLR